MNFSNVATVSKAKIDEFARKCALLNIEKVKPLATRGTEIIRPRITKYDLFCQFLNDTKKFDPDQVLWEAGLVAKGSRDADEEAEAAAYAVWIAVSILAGDTQDVALSVDQVSNAVEDAGTPAEEINALWEQVTA